MPPKKEEYMELDGSLGESLKMAMAAGQNLRLYVELYEQDKTSYIKLAQALGIVRETVNEAIHKLQAEHNNIPPSLFR
jgi:ABC-type antimicrobial peptide transport system ATPase subunit